MSRNQTRGAALVLACLLVVVASLSIQRPAAAIGCRIPYVQSGRAHGTLSVPFFAQPGLGVSLSAQQYLLPMQPNRLPGQAGLHNFNWQISASVSVNGKLVASKTAIGTLLTLNTLMLTMGSGVATFNSGPGYDWTLTLKYWCPDQMK